MAATQPTGFADRRKKEREYSAAASAAEDFSTGFSFGHHNNNNTSTAHGSGTGFGRNSNQSLLDYNLSPSNCSKQLPDSDGRGLDEDSRGTGVHLLGKRVYSKMDETCCFFTEENSIN